ncbi:MAG: T9SS type A sorting domain-containing protein [Paludibacter sp.]|nr:T9SS type A sorting domain-containing protein [Paludibacter sp.]
MITLKSVLTSGLLLVFCVGTQYLQAQFTVTFDTNGGSAVPSMHNITSIETEPQTNRTGNFHFDGWYATSNFSDCRIEFPYTVTEDITLFAKWNIPIVFAACGATHEIAVLDNDFNLWGNFSVGYPGLEEYCLPVGLGIYDNKIMVIDVVMQGLFSYDLTTDPPIAVGEGDNLGNQPNQIIVDGDYGYVILSGSDLIKVINLAAPSTAYGNQRMVTTIPARIGSGTERTNPTYGTMYGNKLYVSLTGITGYAGGDKLLEIAVHNIDTNIDATTAQILATRELSFLPSEMSIDVGITSSNPSPAGVAAANGKLYVALGNLAVISGIPKAAGSGYLAVIDTALWTKTLYILPDGCRNPRQVLATDNRIYIACPGYYDELEPNAAALVVLDAVTMDVVNVTTFPACLPDGTQAGPITAKAAAPGRMTIVENNLVIADENTNRLFVTDLDGNIKSEMSEGIKVCNFMYYSPTEASQAMMDITSLFISVDSISWLPTTAQIFTPLILTGIVYPYYSSNKEIIWSITDDSNATIEDNIFNAIETGMVEITATIKNGLSPNEDYVQGFYINVVEGTGIDEMQNMQLKIYPNPVKDDLKVINYFENGQYSITDLAGKQILSGKLSNNSSINVSSLQQGIYIIKVGNERGKFIKE